MINLFPAEDVKSMLGSIMFKRQGHGAISFKLSLPTHKRCEALVQVKILLAWCWKDPKDD